MFWDCLLFCLETANFEKHKFQIIYIVEGLPICGLVVRVLGYRSGGPGSIPGTTKKK
jgi:hypothetical protein